MIVVVTERKLTAPGKFNPASLEALAAGQQLGRQLGLPVSAVVLEAADSGLAAELAQYRLARVLHAVHPALAVYSPDVWVQALVQVLTPLAAAFVLLPHTYQVRDFAPQLATRLGSGLIGAFRADRVEAGTAPIEPVAVSPAASRLQAGEVFQEAKQAVDLTQAPIIVSVGRGIKEPKNLDLVRELAQAL